MERVVEGYYNHHQERYCLLIFTANWTFLQAETLLTRFGETPQSSVVCCAS
jgi:hypothetical protein